MWLKGVSLRKPNLFAHWEITWRNANGKDNRSRMRREPHVRFCENLELKHFNLLIECQILLK